MSHQDDPFGSPPDATVLRPRPGAGRQGSGLTITPQAPLASDPHHFGIPASVRELLGIGLNPLVRAAAPLLLMAGRLRSSPAATDVLGIREDALAEIREFEEHARSLRVATEVVTAARYALCAALDEAVLTTPWGAQSEWSQRTLLVELHNEARGGEKFFDVLDGISADPARHIDLMELYYVCLAFGFAGKHETMDRGHEALAGIREALHRRIQAQRDTPPTELSIRWRGREDQSNRLIRDLPWWVLPSAALTILAVLLFVYVGYLARLAVPVKHELARVGTEFAQPGPAVPLQGPSLRVLLTADEERGEVLVDEDGTLTTITLLAPDLFDSGRATINPQYEDVLRRIAEAVDRVPGRAVVEGHTDDVPYRGARFDDNFHLSDARAQEAAEILQIHLDDPGRVIAVGKGSSEPRYSASEPDYRARNRRVEIIHVMAAAGS